MLPPAKRIPTFGSDQDERARATAKKTRGRGRGELQGLSGRSKARLRGVWPNLITKSGKAKMARRLHWQDEVLPPVDRSEPTFDLTRAKPHTPARATPPGVLIWRAPTQISRLRREQAAAATETVAEDRTDGAYGLPRRGRRRAVRFLGSVLVIGAIWASVSMLASSPSAQNEALSWITLGHRQEAARAIKVAEVKIHALLRK